MVCVLGHGAKQMSLHRDRRIVVCLVLSSRCFCAGHRHGPQNGLDGSWFLWGPFAIHESDRLSSKGARLETRKKFHCANNSSGSVWGGDVFMRCPKHPNREKKAGYLYFLVEDTPGAGRVRPPLFVLTNLKQEIVSSAVQY